MQKQKNKLKTLIFLFLYAYSTTTWPQKQPNIRQLSFGIHLIHAEIADDPGSREAGLMFRKKMDSQQGMLFIFEGKHIQCMWMRNTFIPLTVAFLDDNGAITNLATMMPNTENSHCSNQPVKYALEMNAGWFEKRGIKLGTKISGLP